MVCTYQVSCCLCAAVVSQFFFHIQNVIFYVRNLMFFVHRIRMFYAVVHMENGFFFVIKKIRFFCCLLNKKL